MAGAAAASTAANPNAKAETRFMPKAAPVCCPYAALRRTLFLLYYNNMTTRYGGGNQMPPPRSGTLVHRRQGHRLGGNVLVLVAVEGDQALVRQIAFLAHRALADIFGDEFPDARDHADMGVLHIDEEFTADRIGLVGDGVEGRFDALDLGALQLVGILFQVGIAEDAERRRVGFQLLDDQVVILAGFHIAAVLADRLASGLLGIALERLQLRVLVAALVHDQFDKRVARAGGRRRAQHFDLLVRERRVDLAPLLVRIVDDLAVDRHL